MKIFKFIMKYVDHGADSSTSKKYCFEIEIKCDWEPTWSHNENDWASHKAWMLKHMEWEHALKQKVKQVLKEMYPDFEFGAYRLIAVEQKKEGCMVNLNHGNPQIPANQIQFKKVKWCEVHKCKHSKGTHPNMWNKMLNYKKESHSHVFTINPPKNEDDLNIQFKSECQYELGNDIQFKPRPLAAPKIETVVPEVATVPPMAVNPAQVMVPVPTTAQMTAPPTFGQKVHGYAQKVHGYTQSAREYLPGIPVHKVSSQSGGENADLKKFIKYKTKYYSLKNRMKDQMY